MNKNTLDQALRDAADAHVAWKRRLDDAVATGKHDLQVADVRRDDNCAFGKFLYSDDIDAETRQGKPYQVIRRLHAEFHETAANVLHLVALSRREEASQVMTDEYKLRSEKLMRGLFKWRDELKR